MIKSVSEIVDRQNQGKLDISYLYKPTVAASAFAGGWVDMSMSSGIPIYNAYVGGQLEATALNGNKNNGVYLGSGRRRLVQTLIQSRSACVPAYSLLLDYLLFYPLVELDNTDLQETLAVDSLPRYQTGEGVRIMPVITLPSAAAGICTISYTNSKGVAGRIVTLNLLQGLFTGNIAASGNTVAGNSGANPFVGLVSGDSGVRSIESIKMTTGVGGFACFVLVKPLSSSVIPEINTASEVNLAANKLSLPVIENGAFLNFAILTQASVASNWLGQITTVLEN